MNKKPVLLTTILASAFAAPAANSRQAGLEPWQVTSLSTHSPSGRPGNNPHSTLNVTIHDPNTIAVTQTPTGTAVFPPSTANCSAQWLTAEDVPWGVEQPCSEIDHGYWTFKMTGGESGTTDFGLEFKLVDNVTVLNQAYTKVFSGGALFKVGDNLSGQCGGSGVCNWGLSKWPFLVQQTEESAS
ncbi:hypothetical protein BS50DRAFT_567961 [Corynespora cassiicola Philippines]|uniref:Cell death in tomato 1 n=1 Tax=Corynespora cassiicola Philippines TaxID=1448308 RepID=A0A2T2PC67_CORCC|nr:hypothetical protein BS50DRAFT_567961 [Corynespora cassiicola Philippines]